MSRTLAILTVALALGACQTTGSHVAQFGGGMALGLACGPAAPFCAMAAFGARAAQREAKHAARMERAAIQKELDRKTQQVIAWRREA